MSAEVVNVEKKTVELVDSKPSDRKYYLLGAVGGLVLGVVAAYLFIRTAEESMNTSRRVKTGQMIKLAVGIITLLRQVASLPADE